ncbi:protein NYNRIN-like [Polypterus senegalus]|uniref:protein NYNRIN-like n=1 Tax=Polypterus senegalus TaxID=55291 RepID=UPI0019661961|nr:protein NYNRIN-like [Polypterus senegalus]
MVWNDKAEAAFSDLKQALTSAPVLKAPDSSLPVILQMDTSDTDLGAMLSQSINGVEHPIMFLSWKLLEQETRDSLHANANALTRTQDLLVRNEGLRPFSGNSIWPR